MRFVASAQQLDPPPFLNFFVVSWTENFVHKDCVCVLVQL